MNNVRVRTYTEEDEQHFKACLSQDQYHSDMDPDWWTESMQVFYDDDGNRLYVKVEPLIRLHIQHDPASPKRAVANLLAQGCAGLKTLFGQQGCKEMIFESTAEPLISFCERELGFEPLEDNYVTVM